MKLINWCRIALLATLLTAFNTFGQKADVRLGPDKIAENQLWQLTVTIQNERLRSYSKFPEIDGFQQSGTSSSSQTSYINGVMSSSESVTMTYRPLKQGVFTLAPFTMTLNSEHVESGGMKITVGPPIQSQQQNDPFRNFFRNPSREPDTPTEFIDVKDDAFFALTTSKQEVFTGEGFSATLALYVSDENQAQMQFYDLSKQLSDILKKIKPANCWEENFNIENIEPERVNLNGRPYTRYKVYQATFYPLNTSAIVFPSVSLEMIKFKVARNPSFFGSQRQEDRKTFSSASKTVKVKPLPPHPLRDKVAVGNYYLQESIGSLVVPTGKSVQYDFKVYGEGNISAINKPSVKKDSHFDFYEPNVKQNIDHANGKVRGTKSFSYFLIPKDPGTYKLGDYFQWIFFNPEKEKYDTLKSAVIMEATGESKKDLTIESNETGSFYNRIESTDNTLRAASNNHWIVYAVSLFVLVILSCSAYLALKK